jgi:hypothetical protein
MTCASVGAVVRCSGTLSAVQRSWEHPAAPNLLPTVVAYGREHRGGITPAFPQVIGDGYQADNVGLTMWADRI